MIAELAEPRIGANILRPFPRVCVVGSGNETNILSVDAIKFSVIASLIFRGSCKFVSNLEPVTCFFWFFWRQGGGVADLETFLSKEINVTTTKFL